MKKQVNIRIPLRVLALLMGLFLSIGAYAQITVNGNVKDAQGEPVIGASVRVVGNATQGVATDLDGNFTLSNVAQGAKLQISSVGYETLTVSAAPDLVITLNENTQALNEVVVIGYGVAKKSDLTGSVTAIKPDTKNRGVVVNAQDLLAGKVAGVSVTSQGGTPGGKSTIRIRGGSSLNASNDPLVVIDGIPMDNNGIKGMSNGLAMVNPLDIESFNVLKDASATAIYGSRGSNGVIIITTKKGRRGQKPQVSYNGSVTMSVKRKTIDVMSGDEYRDYVKKVYDGSSLYDTAVGLLGTASTNWQDEILRTAWSTDHNLQVSGSVGKYLPYRVSLGYTGEQGIVKTSDFKRYTVSANLNPSLLNDHLVVNLNAKWMWGKNHYADGGAISNALRIDPTQPVSVASGFENFNNYFEWTSSNSDLGDSAWPVVTNTNAPRNPVAILELKNDRAHSHDFNGSADIDYKVHGFEDLRLHTTIGGDFSGGKQNTDVLPGCPQASYWGSYGWANGTKENLTWSEYLQYYKDFDDMNHFDIMAGHEWQHFWRKENSYYINKYPDNSALTATDDAGNVTPLAGTTHIVTLQNSGKGYRTENYLESYFGRMQYNYAERYFLTFTFRADGSSRFNWLKGFDNQQWGYFPSAALAWAINKESFLKNATALSDLKLRLGWGKTGQQEGISDYSYYANYAINTGVQGSFYDIMGDGTMARPNAYNPALKWETTTTTNVGLDWGLWNQKLSGSIDWYYRKTTDLINYTSVAAMSNFRNQTYRNIGSMRNTGVEASISYKAINTADLRWNIDFNLTYNSNKITELVSTDPNFYVETGSISSGIGQYVQAHAVGHPMSSFYVYQQVYDQNGKTVEGQYVDRNGDGVISEADRYFYKSPNAPWRFGLATRLEYKNWDLGMSFRANLGNYVYNDAMATNRNVGTTSMMEQVSGNYLQNRPVYCIDNGWTTTTTVGALSDYWVQNASFLKCDNITLGYSFANLFKCGNYQGIGGRFYVTASNVFTITKYKGIDPEVDGGIDNQVYPRPFSLIMGLSLSF